MSIYKADSLQSLIEFRESTLQLGIFERRQPEGGASFFKNLMKQDFEIKGTINLMNVRNDLRKLLLKIIDPSLRVNDFYNYWLSDMEEVCKTFCYMENTNSLSFWLGTRRGCRRYHVDNVSKRLLVTYAGQGTEWIPNNSADRRAYEAGEPNKNIIRNKNDLNFIDEWSIAIFKGGSDGILHRTPDTALNGPSILMRLDHPDFLIKTYTAETFELN
tara:strand:+ start:599 stop:1246 length:648 start_codon:yes stop_codon:yes gene_type:complete